MLFPIQDRWVLSTEYWQSRPLSVSYHERTHPHAAWDAACPVGTDIRAPENGNVYYLIAFRADISRRLSEVNLHPEPFRLHGHHYFYDTYGGVIILLGESGKTHVITHSYANQIYGIRIGEQWQYEESRNDERWPVSVWHTFGAAARVPAGAVIGRVGNAGYSTGPHIHYEIHQGREYKSPIHRVDPRDVYPEEWDEHEGDVEYDWNAERKRWQK